MIKRYTVSVYFYSTICNSTEIEIEADSPEEAEDIALNLACEGEIPDEKFTAGEAKGDGDFFVEVQENELESGHPLSPNNRR